MSSDTTRDLDLIDLQMRIPPGLKGIYAHSTLQDVKSGGAPPGCVS